MVESANEEGEATAITVFSTVKPAGRVWLPVLFWATGRFSSLTRTLRDLEFIYFARWNLIRELPYNGEPQRKGRLRYPHLFFESNFTGSWDEYIDAFSRKLTLGMRTFWGSSYGFPGALPTGPFKTYIRGNETVAAHYFSAYPDASVADITRALKLAGHVSGPGQASAFMAMCPILPGHEPELTALLQGFGEPGPFARLPRTHFARFVVIDGFHDDPAQPGPEHEDCRYLVFTACLDGDVDSYIDELCAFPETMAIIAHCLGDRTDPKGYLLHNRIRTGLFYAPYGHATTGDVRAALDAYPPDGTRWDNRIPVERIHSGRLAQALLAKQGPERCMHFDEIGCCKAVMIPLPERPEWAKHGVFERHGEVPCTLRYSTQDGIVGLAIMWDRDMVDDSVSDIVAVSGRAFFFRSIEEVGEAKRLEPKPFGKLRAFIPSLNPARWHWRALHNLATARRMYPWTPKIRNPLDADLCSLQAFDHYGTIVRWFVRPLGKPIGAVGADLRGALAVSVAGQPVALEVLAQVQTNPARMPDDDPTIPWPEHLSPLVAVAHVVTLPEQQLIDGFRLRVMLRGGRGSVGRGREEIYPKLQAKRLDDPTAATVEPHSTPEGPV